MSIECTHGRQASKCEVCQLIAAEAEGEAVSDLTKPATDDQIADVATARDLSKILAAERDLATGLLARLDMQRRTIEVAAHTLAEFTADPAAFYSQGEVEIAKDLLSLLGMLESAHGEDGWHAQIVARLDTAEAEVARLTAKYEPTPLLAGWEPIDRAWTRSLPGERDLYVYERPCVCRWVIEDEHGDDVAADEEETLAEAVEAAEKAAKERWP